MPFVPARVAGIRVRRRGPIRWRKQQCTVRVELWLIILHHQQLVPTLRHDLLGTRALGEMGIDRKHAVGKRAACQEQRHRRTFVALGADPYLVAHTPGVMLHQTDEMNLGRPRLAHPAPLYQRLPTPATAL